MDHEHRGSNASNVIDRPNLRKPAARMKACQRNPRPSDEWANGGRILRQDVVRELLGGRKAAVKNNTIQRRIDLGRSSNQGCRSHADSNSEHLPGSVRLLFPKVL